MYNPNVSHKNKYIFPDSGIPSAPGVPDVVDAGIGEVTVVWSAPLQSNGGEVRGYQIEMREFPDGEWESMGVDHLLKDTTCRGEESGKFLLFQIGHSRCFVK